MEKEAEGGRHCVVGYYDRQQRSYIRMGEGGREIGLISPEEGQGYHLAEGHRETIDSFRAAFIVPFQCSGNGIDCLSVMCTVPRNRYVSVLGDVAVNIFPLYSW